MGIPEPRSDDWRVVPIDRAAGRNLLPAANRRRREEYLILKWLEGLDAVAFNGYHNQQGFIEID